MTKHTDTRRPSRFPAMLPASLLTLAAASCVSDPAGLDPAQLGAVDLTPVTTAGDQWNSCPTWDCGKNHPMLDNFPVHELHEAGIPNDDHYYISSFTRSGKALTLTVEQGVMTGSNQTTSYTGDMLLGSIMTVHNQATGVTWEIEIYDYTRGLEYWAGPGLRPAYHLRYRALRSGTHWQNLCNAPLEPSDDPLWPDGFETYAILIDDERYDRDAKQVREGDGEGWFNIACAGSTLAKMVLMHYDPNLPPGDDYETEPDERTALIKMLTADYLGTGEPFTKGGILLQWADTRGWHPMAAPGVPEAVWNQAGAVCLEWPRLYYWDDGILADIQGECPSPGCTMPDKCSDLGITNENWSQHGLWATWNPWW